MRYSRRHHKAERDLAFNATAMVDVIFLLTIFFMLVSRFSSAEQIPMELPKPEQSRARSAKTPDRVIINCRLAGPNHSDPVLYSIGPNRPERLGVIADRLVEMKRKSPQMRVVVRADRRLRYEDVRAVMRIIARCDIEMLNVVAHVAEGE